MENKFDMTPSINQIIDGAVKNKVVNIKKIQIKYHTVEQLYTRIRTLLRLATALYPQLAFKSLRHYDEVNDSIKTFNDDFIVGVYTPMGPAAFHFKLEFLNEFSHIPFQDSAPKYDGYTEDEGMQRLNSLNNLITIGASIDEIIEIINENKNLDESQKPKLLIKK